MVEVVNTADGVRLDRLLSSITPELAARQRLLNNLFSGASRPVDRGTPGFPEPSTSNGRDSVRIGSADLGQCCKGQPGE